MLQCGGRGVFLEDSNDSPKKLNKETPVCYNAQVVGASVSSISMLLIIRETQLLKKTDIMLCVCSKFGWLIQVSFIGSGDGIEEFTGQMVAKAYPN